MLGLKILLILFLNQLLPEQDKCGCKYFITIFIKSQDEKNKL